MKEVSESREPSGPLTKDEGANLGATGGLIEDPFFIFYDSRSGSTFLARQLVKHAPVVIPPEANFVGMFIERHFQEWLDRPVDVSRFVEVLRQDEKFSDWGIDCEEVGDDLERAAPVNLGTAIRRVCTLYQLRRRPEARAFGIKKNFIRHHVALRRLFPCARTIVLLRDGRAVFNSKKHSIYSVTSRPMETNPYWAAHIWRAHVLLARELERSRPQSTRILHYESMVAERDALLRDLCNDFLGVPFSADDTACGDYFGIPERYGDLHLNADRSAIAERIGAWRNSLPRRDVLAYESVAHMELIAEGYELINPLATTRAPCRALQVAMRLAAIGALRRASNRLGRLRALRVPLGLELRRPRPDPRDN